MMCVRRHHLLFGVALLLALASAGRGAAPATQPLPDAVDDVVFLDGLRQRGLNDWIHQYGQDVSAGDEVAASLFRRETLLGKAAEPGRPVEQVRADIVSAGELLVKLIAAHPEHPGRFFWRLELARDCLERRRPEVFDALLLYEMPGADAAIVSDPAKAAIEQLTALREEIASAWKSVEALDEPPLAALRSSGSLALLESADAQTLMLLTWARLYQELAREAHTGGPGFAEATPGGQAAGGTAGGSGGQAASGTRDGSGTSGFDLVLAAVNKSGWLELPPGREPEQAGALLMAAIAERHLDQNAQAEAHARQIITLLDRTQDKSIRQRLRRTILLAVLEQIRVARDAGEFDTALAAAGQARQWCLKSRPDDVVALVAVALLESHTLHCRHVAAGRSKSPPAGSAGVRARLAGLGGVPRRSGSSRPSIDGPSRLVVRGARTRAGWGDGPTSGRWITGRGKLPARQSPLNWC